MEDIVFKILIPMDNVAELQVGPYEVSREAVQKTGKETDKEINKETDKEINKETNKETNKEIVDKIIDMLKAAPEMTVKNIAENLNVSVSGVNYHINKMKKAGMIAHIGPTKRGKWVVYK